MYLSLLSRSIYLSNDAISSQSIELLNDSDSDAEKPTGSNGLVTVSLTPATRSQEMSAGQIKPEREREYQRKKRANNKRAMSVVSIDGQEVIPKRTTKRQRMQDEGIIAE